MKFLIYTISCFLILTGSLLMAEPTKNRCSCTKCECTEENNCGCIPQEDQKKYHPQCCESCGRGESCQCGNSD